MCLFHCYPLREIILLNNLNKKFFKSFNKMFLNLSMLIIIIKTKTFKLNENS